MRRTVGQGLIPELPPVPLDEVEREENPYLEAVPTPIQQYQHLFVVHVPRTYQGLRSVPGVVAPEDILGPHPGRWRKYIENLILSLGAGLTYETVMGTMVSMLRPQYFQSQILHLVRFMKDLGMEVPAEAAIRLSMGVATGTRTAFLALDMVEVIAAVLAANPVALVIELILFLAFEIYDEVQYRQDIAEADEAFREDAPRHFTAYELQAIMAATAGGARGEEPVTNDQWAAWAVGPESPIAKTLVPMMSRLFGNWVSKQIGDYIEVDLPARAGIIPDLRYDTQRVTAAVGRFFDKTLELCRQSFNLNTSEGLELLGGQSPLFRITPEQAVRMEFDGRYMFAPFAMFPDERDYPLIRMERERRLPDYWEGRPLPVEGSPRSLRGKIFALADELLDEINGAVSVFRTPLEEAQYREFNPQRGIFFPGLQHSMRLYGLDRIRPIDDEGLVAMGGLSENLLKGARRQLTNVINLFTVYLRQIGFDKRLGFAYSPQYTQEMATWVTEGTPYQKWDGTVGRIVDPIEMAAEGSPPAEVAQAEEALAEVDIDAWLDTYEARRGKKGKGIATVAKVAALLGVGFLLLRGR